jgi:hypothetical protein
VNTKFRKVSNLIAVNFHILGDVFDSFYYPRIFLTYMLIIIIGSHIHNHNLLLHTYLLVKTYILINQNSHGSHFYKFHIVVIFIRFNYGHI